MSLISPNFDVKSVILFPILARGLFRKLLEKALNFAIATSQNKVNIPVLSEGSMEPGG